MTRNMIDYNIIGFASIALVSLMSLLMALRFKEIATIIFVYQSSMLVPLGTL